MTATLLERPKTKMRTGLPDSLPDELREAIEEGLRDIEEGRVYSTEEVFDEIAEWLEKN